MAENLRVTRVDRESITLKWDSNSKSEKYEVLLGDKDTETMRYEVVAQTEDSEITIEMSTHRPWFFKVRDSEGVESNVAMSSIGKRLSPRLERLSRGLIAAKKDNGIFLSWRLMRDEVSGYSENGLTGTDFNVYRNGERISTVLDSTNYYDENGTVEDEYYVVAVDNGIEGDISKKVRAFKSGSNYVEVKVNRPEGGITPAGEAYEYNINDMSIADVDGDGEYEYILKWDPSNSHDVSIKGYTGKCYIDCYRIDGTQLWRVDMGVNIRAGAHYTQFIVYDFEGTGKACMSVKTAPGTKITTYNEDGSIKTEEYITIPEEDLRKGVTHEDNYVCDAQSYREHLIDVFMNYHNHEEVLNGHWPKTLEECFGIEDRYIYPLSREDATDLVNYFIDDYAKMRSPKNQLDRFEGFIYEGPEYLTMFSGDGHEIETIPFRFKREDDGLKWGDYAMARIEPCNRVDRFLSGVAYLDGENPYLIICRGYYTRTTICAYRFEDGHHKEYFAIDSGHVIMNNPFNDNAHIRNGSDPVYGILAGQGNHSLSTADVDNDGYQEIIYGAAVIDHDGSILYSSHDYLPNGQDAKLGHGDAMHVANIDPDKNGLEIFNVFEGAREAPYGYALRDARDGKVIFGEYAECDLGRCMIGDIDKNTRGLQVWVRDTYDCRGNKLDVNLLGTNCCIHWAADLTTQVLDGVNYEHDIHTGIINDNIHGVMLLPEGMATNNGTKGNPCLVADIFGDFRENLVLRRADNSAFRIYVNTDITNHKLYTPMHDIQYRTSVAWQNNCYNQPGYTSYYYASDMDFKYVMPELLTEKCNSLC